MAATDKEFSLIQSKILDSTGDSFETVKRRRTFYEDSNHYLLENCSLVGGCAEGVNRISESDRDYIVYLPEFKCTEDSSLKDSCFKYRFYETHPGYGILKPEDTKDVNSLVVRDILSRERFQKLFKNKYMSKLPEKTQRQLERKGPAFSFSIHGIKYDYVGSIPFHCPTLVKNWTLRQRDHDWPPTKVIQEISEMDGTLVAVGCKGCQETEKEWRVCFNKIELILVKELNEIQTKLYQTLKLLKKCI